MLGEIHCQPVADPADRHRIQGQHWQAGVNLQRRRLQLQAGTEQDNRKPCTQALDKEPLEEQALTTRGEVVHRHHCQDGHAGQWVELHGGSPESTHQRIDQQVAVFGVIGDGGASSQLKRQVWPDQAIEQQQAPDPRWHLQG
ncbi:hypothetical protein D3C72_1656120 [compost metagenome]